MTTAWKRCSTCKADIAFGATYYVCSVSTCNRKRTGLTFCSVACWDQHVPLMRHRDAGAVEETAPTREQWLAASTDTETKPAKKAEPPASSVGTPTTGPKRRVVGPKPAPLPPGPEDTLVVVSRFKHYVKTAHGLNTSDAVMDVLSEHLRRLVLRAADSAREDGRKTLLDRDFAFLKR